MSPKAVLRPPLGNWFKTDEQFNQLYPQYIQLLARRHWTPLHITQLAAEFLVPEQGVNVMDIGSGVGKFCLAAAYYRPFASFFGVEQRKNLVEYAEAARKISGLQNACFIHRNFTQLDFSRYDHFYFYNSFHENLSGTARIDNNISYSPGLYNYYNRYLFNILENKPAGTRLVTFHSLEDEIPPGYHLVQVKADNLLKFWEKL